MLKIWIVGRGRMGGAVEAEIAACEDLALAGASEYVPEADSIGAADVIIDFSHPNNPRAVCERAARDGTALVLGTTGLGDAHRQYIAQAAQKAPVVHSANFSTGIAIFERLLAEMRGVSHLFDIEVVEAHHRYKQDAPSGTAKLLLAAIDPENERERIYGRGGMGARGNEIGVHSIRGGTVAGEHSGLFLGEDEVLEIRHSAASRRIFARGALTAARFAAGKAPGLYSMQDVLWGGKDA